MFVKKLKDDEILEMHNSILAALNKKTGAQLRG